VYKGLRRRVERRRLGSMMFERFTERARKSVVLAEEEAGLLRHNYIGTEHLLLGLLREDEGVAARALAALGVTIEEARERVESIVSYGTEAPGLQAPFTPRSKKVLELALREALHLEHNYIGTEHILLGLVRENEGVGARVLSDLGVSPADVRRELARMLPRVSGRRLEEERGEAGPPEPARDPLLFRGRVGSLRITARFDDQPETLLLDLDYAYAVPDTEDATGVVDHDDLLAGATGVLEARDLGSIEAGVLKVGEYVLESFPAVTEITVSATDQRVLEAHEVSGFTISRIFRR
jgi:Clp amino terminal domain, pathogenicity island component